MWARRKRLKLRIYYELVRKRKILIVHFAYLVAFGFFIIFWRFAKIWVPCLPYKENERMSLRQINYCPTYIYTHMPTSAIIAHDVYWTCQIIKAFYKCGIIISIILSAFPSPARINSFSHPNYVKIQFTRKNFHVWRISRASFRCIHTYNMNLEPTLYWPVQDNN